MKDLKWAVIKPFSFFAFISHTIMKGDEEKMNTFTNYETKETKMKKKMKPETKEKIKRVAEGFFIGCASAASVLGIAIVVNSIGSKSANKKEPMYIQFGATPADKKVHMKVLNSKGKKIVGIGTNVENAKKTFEDFKEAIEKAES